MKTYKTYKTSGITLKKVHSDFYCGTYKTKGGKDFSVFVERKDKHWVSDCKEFKVGDKFEGTSVKKSLARLLTSLKFWGY